MRLVLGPLLALGVASSLWAGQTYTAEQAVAVAREENPEIAIARKKLEAANGGVIEARSGYLPSIVSTGLLREREHQTDTGLRNEDYNASVRMVQSVYSAGAVSAQLAIARLNVEKATLELEAVSNRVAMDTRVAFYELLLNRARIDVRHQSVDLLGEELKTQKDRFGAGLVGQLNVSRAEVAFANEQPELFDAETQLQNSYIRLGQLLGKETGAKSAGIEAAGRLQYRPRYPDLNVCLVRAAAARPEIRSREIDVEIETYQEQLDMSELRPKVEAFSGYEVYNERDVDRPRDLNHGYVIGLNARWHIFDGFATKGRVIATRARREAAEKSLEAMKLAVAGEVRSAFLDLQQADRVLESETKNVRTADESLEVAKANSAAGLGTQLDVLQAASDVTKTRTTRLSAIYLHQVAQARLARACASTPDDLEGSGAVTPTAKTKKPASSVTAKAPRPPAKVTKR